MAEITAALVKDLREKTGVGMMDCKKALAENNGDLEASIDWLRAKGLSKAAKKADRAAAEGIVAVALDGSKGAVIELNSETDFVARNADFQKAASQFSKLALSAGNHDALLKTSHRRRRCRGCCHAPDRHHRRKHYAPPFGAALASRTASWPLMCTTRSMAQTPWAGWPCSSPWSPLATKLPWTPSARRWRCTSPRPRRSR